MLIAEIGQNFLGDIKLAKWLIQLAQANGADLAKFQLYDSKKLYGEYQDTELTKGQALELFNYGKEVGIEVFFSVFDTERVKWCEEIGVARYKVAYWMRDKKTLDAILNTGRPVIASGDLDYMPDCWNLLYCVSEYPAKTVDFRSIDFDIFSGFSDHTIGLDTAKIAIARGARIIEKHLAINHQDGVDAEWSMTPGELRGLRRFYEYCSKFHL